MPHNCYSQLDALLQTHQNVQDYVLAHAAELADAPAHKTIYSTPFLLLGLYTPTLLLGIHYSGAYKKGQKLKSSGNRTDYLSYDYDSDGNLLRIMDHGDGLKFFYCIIRHDGLEWAIPIFRNPPDGRYCHYPHYSKFTEWDEQGRVVKFGQIRGNDFLLETYRYDVFEQGALCDFWHYIPTLAHSCKSTPLSQAGSPADLYRYRLDLTDPKHISGTLLESYTHDHSVSCDLIPQKIFQADPSIVLPQPLLYNIE